MKATNLADLHRKALAMGGEVEGAGKPFNRAGHVVPLPAARPAPVAPPPAALALADVQRDFARQLEASEARFAALLQESLRAMSGAFAQALAGIRPNEQIESCEWEVNTDEDKRITGGVFRPIYRK